MTFDPDQAQADAAAQVQLKLLTAATAVLNLVQVIAPQLSADQADALTCGMRSGHDCPALLLELRAAGPRITVLAFERGVLQELAEFTLQPVALPGLEGGASLESKASSPFATGRPSFKEFLPIIDLSSSRDFKQGSLPANDFKRPVRRGASSATEINRRLSVPSAAQALV